jgi:hypothetical protein
MHLDAFERHSVSKTSQGELLVPTIAPEFQMKVPYPLKFASCQYLAVSAIVSYFYIVVSIIAISKRRILKVR